MKHHFPTHGYDGYTRPLFVFHCAAVALCEQTGGEAPQVATPREARASAPRRRRLCRTQAPVLARCASEPCAAGEPRVTFGQ